MDQPLLARASQGERQHFGDVRLQSFVGRACDWRTSRAAPSGPRPCCAQAGAGRNSGGDGLRLETLLVDDLSWSQSGRTQARTTRVRTLSIGRGDKPIRDAQISQHGRCKAPFSCGNWRRFCGQVYTTRKFGWPRAAQPCVTPKGLPPVARPLSRNVGAGFSMIATPQVRPQSRESEFDAKKAAIPTQSVGTRSFSMRLHHSRSSAEF